MNKKKKKIQKNSQYHGFGLKVFPNGKKFGLVWESLREILLFESSYLSP